MRVSVSAFALIAVMSLLISASRAGTSDVCFCREEVSITLEADAVVFESLYCFENRTSEPCEQKMLYAFDIDSVHVYPDTISVQYGFMDLAYETTDDGIVFTVGMPGESCASVRVEYTQRCLDPSFCYTPKTMTGWKEPIQEADFEIRIPSGLTLESVSYSMQQVSEEEGLEIQRFTCSNCLPSEDLCMRWKAK